MTHYLNWADYPEVPCGAQGNRSLSSSPQLVDCPVCRKAAAALPAPADRA